MAKPKLNIIKPALGFVQMPDEQSGVSQPPIESDFMRHRYAAQPACNYYPLSCAVH